MNKPVEERDVRAGQWIMGDDKVPDVTIGVARLRQRTERLLHHGVEWICLLI